MRSILTPGGKRLDALLAAPHQHDALNDVVGFIHAGDAEPWFLADHDIGDIPHQNRIAVALRDHRGGEVVDRADQADTTHHRRLRADVDRVAADIDVGVADGLDHLRERQAERCQLADVDLQFIGLGLAAPAGDVDDAGDRAEAPLQDPVLQCLEIEHAVARRADEAITEDFADRAQR